MSDYTPTTKQVRRAYQDDQSRKVLIDQVEPYSRDVTGSEFDRWYATELAAAEKCGAVKALREAASAIHDPVPTLDDIDTMADFYAEWLSDRADQENQ